MINFNEEARIVHENNAKWWIDIRTGEPLDRNKGEMLMLVVTELAEAAEGIRKNLMDDHLPTRPMAEVELADAFIRMLDFSGGFGITLDDEALNEVWDTELSALIDQLFLVENKLEGLLDITSMVVALGEVVKPGSQESEQTVSILTSLVIIYILAYALQHDYDIIGAYREKNEYNKTRKDHSIEERLKENGKKV